MDFHRIIGELTKNTITHLNLSRHWLSLQQVTLLSLRLHDNTSLHTLILDESGISAAGALELAKMLRVNRTLMTLSLNKNPIGDEGVQYLRDALVANRTLRSLKIDTHVFVALDALESIFTAISFIMTIRHGGIGYIEHAYHDMSIDPGIQDELSLNEIAKQLRVNATLNEDAMTLFHVLALLSYPSHRFENAFQGLPIDLLKLIIEYAIQYRCAPVHLEQWFSNDAPSKTTWQSIRDSLSVFSHSRRVNYRRAILAQPVPALPTTEEPASLSLR